MKTGNKLLFTKATTPIAPPDAKPKPVVKGSLPIDLGEGYKIGLHSLFTTSTAKVATTDWMVDLTNRIAYHRNKLP